MKAPAKTWPSVTPTSPSRPAASLPKFCSWSCTLCSAEFSWASVTCRGPVRSQDRIWSIPLLTWFERSPTPEETWLPTKVNSRASAATPSSTTSSAASLRRMPMLLHPGHDRSDQRREEQGDHQRQHHDEEEVEQPEEHPQGRADHQQAPGPGCREVDPVGDLRRPEVRGSRQHHLLVAAPGLLHLATRGPQLGPGPQLSWVSSHTARLRARAAAAAGCREASSPTAAST